MPLRSGQTFGEFADVECWCQAPPGDPGFVSLKLCFVEGRACQMLFATSLDDILLQQRCGFKMRVVLYAAHGPAV
jgi:hypothetical protein